MKKTLIATLLAITSFSAGAQDIFENPDNHSYFGIRLGYELACPGDVKIGDVTKIDAFGNSSGFDIGVIYNMPLWKNLYFEPGASIFYNTYSVEKSLLEPVLNEPFKIESASVRQWGIRIPLHLGYHFDFTPDIRVAFFTGPEFNISIKGHTHMGVGKYNVTGPAFGSDGYLNRADIKWRFGVGATIFDHYYIAISGAAGICDMMRDDITIADPETGIESVHSLKMHANVFDITIGYNF